MNLHIRHIKNIRKKQVKPINKITPFSLSFCLLLIFENYEFIRKMYS